MRKNKRHFRLNRKYSVVVIPSTPLEILLSVTSYVWFYNRYKEYCVHTTCNDKLKALLHLIKRVEKDYYLQIIGRKWNDMIIRTLVRKNGTWIFKKEVRTKRGLTFVMSMQFVKDLKDIIYI